MSVVIKKENEGSILEVDVTGKLTHEDYKLFVPEIERLIHEKGKLRILVQMHDFHGWSAMALWDDLKFDIKHFNDVEKVAFVGEKKWQEGMSTFCKPFTTAELKFFDTGSAEEARQWLRQ